MVDELQDFFGVFGWEFKVLWQVGCVVSGFGERLGLEVVQVGAHQVRGLGGALCRAVSECGGARWLSRCPSRSAWRRPCSVKAPVWGSAWPWRARYRSRVVVKSGFLGWWGE